LVVKKKVSVKKQEGKLGKGQGSVEKQEGKVRKGREF